MTEDYLMAAYNMGYIAAKNGQPIEANPYREGDGEQFNHWLEGWNAYTFEAAMKK
jgi:ribosome modulation factor